jgi:predicted XRE-type DNA-binding protein
MKNNNPRSGSTFDAFLKEQGIYDEVTAKALKRAIAEQLKEGMQEQNITKVAMANRMETSRTQVDRLLDPDNLRIQFDSLVKAATAIGKHVEIRLVDNGSAA